MINSTGDLAIRLETSLVAVYHWVGYRIAHVVIARLLRRVVAYERNQYHGRDSRPWTMRSQSMIPKSGYRFSEKDHAPRRS
jgi:hypothetical protein